MYTRQLCTQKFISFRALQSLSQMAISNAAANQCRMPRKAIPMNTPSNSKPAGSTVTPAKPDTNQKHDEAKESTSGSTSPAPGQKK